MRAYDLAWQASLLTSNGARAVDQCFTGLQHIALDERSWVDLVRTWVTANDSLFADLIDNAPWEPQRTRVMWDRKVNEPRIIARWPDLSTLPRTVQAARDAISTRYETDFDAVAVNLYRDGH